MYSVWSSLKDTGGSFKSNKFEVISFFYNVVVRDFFGSTIPKSDWLM